MSRKVLIFVCVGILVSSLVYGVLERESRGASLAPDLGHTFVGGDPEDFRGCYENDDCNDNLDCPQATSMCAGSYDDQKQPVTENFHVWGNCTVAPVTTFCFGSPSAGICLKRYQCDDYDPEGEQPYGCYPTTGPGTDQQASTACRAST